MGSPYSNTFNCSAKLRKPFPYWTKRTLSRYKVCANFLHYSYIIPCIRED